MVIATNPIVTGMLFSVMAYVLPPHVQSTAQNLNSRRTSYLAVNTTCARRVQMKNTAEPYHDIFSHLLFFVRKVIASRKHWL